MRINPLIHTESEPLLLPGPCSYSTQTIRDAHDRVTPVYNPDGNVQYLEIDPRATTTDICAVLISCGISIKAITGLGELDALSRPLRYQIFPAPEIGEGAYDLQVVRSSDSIII